MMLKKLKIKRKTLKKRRKKKMIKKMKLKYNSRLVKIAISSLLMLMIKYFALMLN
jgi:hypothetical protein